MMSLIGKHRGFEVIKSWKHKELQKLYLKDDPSGVLVKDVERLKLRLLVLDEAVSTDDFAKFPNFKFHLLKGNKKNLYAITVRANCFMMVMHTY